MSPPDALGALQRAVFESRYRSREQRTRRALALALLIGLHLGRGALIGLPIYLVTLALAVTLWREQHAWYLLVLVPGVAWWLRVLAHGVRADYRERVSRRLLNEGDLRALFVSR